MNVLEVMNSHVLSVGPKTPLREILQLMLFAKDLPADRISKVVIDETAATRYVTAQGADVLIPVRERIHSSEVSTIFSRSWFVRTPGGT